MCPRSPCSPSSTELRSRGSSANRRCSRSYEAIQVASVTLWGWIVRFAPVGVFALFAVAAGTIEPSRLSGLLLYVALFLIGTLLLAFVVLPLVMASLVPTGYREIVKELRPALVIAVVTTLSVVALPFVQRAAERIADAAGCPDSEERSNVIKAVLALSYVLAQLGNYFLYLLMLYAAYEYKEPLSATEQLLLPVWSLLSGMGSPTAIVDGVVFIGRWLHLPAELTDLFLETCDRDALQPGRAVGGGLRLPPRHSFLCIYLPQGAAAPPSCGRRRGGDGLQHYQLRFCDCGRDGAAVRVAAGSCSATRFRPSPSDPKSREGARCHRWITASRRRRKPRSRPTPTPTLRQRCGQAACLRVGYNGDVPPFQLLERPG